jgi:NodT family efflux transporter outer membrane factor (OMF) lipoprotein
MKILIAYNKLEKLTKMHSCFSCNLKSQARAFLRPEVVAWAATSGVAVAAALATAFLLAGCSTGIEPHETLTQPASLAASQTYSAVAVSADWPSERWWERYQDPELNSLIAEALEGSPSLALAQARLARANAAAGFAEAAAQPGLAASASSQRGKFTANYIYPPPLGGSTYTTDQLFLNFNWDLDFWGKNKAAIDSARAQVKASEADSAAARLALTTSVARAWFQIERLYALEDVTQASIKQREDILVLTRQRVAAGLDTNAELREAESQLPQARVDLSQIQEAIGLARNQIAALLGRGPDRGLTLPRPRGQVSGVIALPAEIPAHLIGRRPDLVAARWRVEAAERNISQAKAEFYPDFNLVASLGLISLGNDVLLRKASENTLLGPAVTLPIYSGSLRANLRATDAEYDAAVVQYNAVLVDALRDVADQITSQQALEVQETQQQLAVEKIEDAYSLALQRYKAGLGNYLLVLTAETDVLQQRRIAAQLKARALDLDVELVRALGGGYTATPPEVAQR